MPVFTTKPRYLTKSRFKLGMECPAKLFYTAKESVYANQNLEDSFLASLAEGGFQVGELAKAYFPDGHEVETLDYEAALAQTNELLKQDCVVIYEAAIRFKNLFIRADILVKKADQLELIEVKAKSYDPEQDGDFLGKRGGIASGWKPYLLDVAFQKHVVSSAFPTLKVRASLMLADKTVICSTDGLNQKFRVVTDVKGRKKAVMTTPLTSEENEHRILRQVNADNICRLINEGTFEEAQGPSTFVERIEWLADHYQRDEKIVCGPASVCAGCEFRTTAKDEAKGLKNGFKECWKHALKWTDKDFETPNVLDIWNFRSKTKLIAENRIAMSDVTQEDIDPENDDKPGLSQSERQWLQVEKVQAKDNSIWIENAALKREMEKWKFPLHFIDFETTRVAIPFNRGRHPYEVVAFQFSHHVMRDDGRIEHRGQYLNTERGVFPNYDFVRALKKELEGDGGSIFRYATHENSTLVAIYRQLSEEKSAPSDRSELQSFIKSITTSTHDSTESWDANRTMIDLCKMVKRYYFAPSTNGSNSIKAVLPALLNQSDFLKKKYAKPIYGAIDGIPSLNFQNKTWIQMDGGQVIDPYKQLPKMFKDVSDHDFERLSEDDELKDGGAAMTAYARMQFEEMDSVERKELEAALLRYCELDTLAMVMIYEAWKDILKDARA
jgi:disulfide oxidoreductase YuzD